VLRIRVIHCATQKPVACTGRGTARGLLRRGSVGINFSYSLTVFKAKNKEQFESNRCKSITAINQGKKTVKWRNHF